MTKQGPRVWEYLCGGRWRPRRISSDGDDRMWAKIKTQKIPLGFQQNPKQSLDQNKHSKLNVCVCFFITPSEVIIREHYREYSHCFEDPKDISLKSSHQKNILDKFSKPKKPRKWKFQTPKNPSIILVTWNPEYLLTDFFSFSAANTLNPTIMPYPAKWIEAPPFLSPP